MSDQFKYTIDSTRVQLLPSEVQNYQDQVTPSAPPMLPPPSPSTRKISSSPVPPPNQQSHSPTSKSCKRVIINMGSGRTKQGHRCTVDCLNRYPIHHAARVGKYKDLKKLLEEYQQYFQEQHQAPPTDPSTSPDDPNTPPNPDPKPPPKCKPYLHLLCVVEKDECLGRTPLHYAAATGNVEKGLLCTKLLLDLISNVIVNPAKRTEKIRKFVNATDYSNETALHLAAKNEATNIVRELLLHQADLDIKSLNGKCGLMEVYKKTPLAMNDALNQSISYVELCRRDDDVHDELLIDDDSSKRKSSGGSEEEIDFTHSYVSVCMNFYPLLGSKVNKGRGKHGAPVPETSFLYEIQRNRMENEVRRIMLNNVLVQAFLHFKWNKIKLFCFVAIFLHILWLALYIGIVIDVFVVNCPFVTEENESEKNDTVIAGSGQAKGFFEEEIALLEGEGTLCRVNPAVHFSSALLILFSFGIAIKELFQFVRLRSLYIRFENMGQCMLLCFIFLGTPNFYMRRVARINPIHYQISAFGIFLAWTLFLCQCAKLPRFCVKFRLFSYRFHINLPDHGLYVEILSRVFKNFLVFISIFSSLLISFVFSFNILLPNSTGFSNLSITLLKVLTMMTGELNYDDIFHDEEDKLVYPVSSHVMYALFIMVATIILFNLLIGFTVSDIQGLQKDAELNQICNKLEQIFLMECFLLSTPMQLLLRVFCKIFRVGKSRSDDILSSIMVTRRTARHTWFCYHTEIKSLPRSHRVQIRDWASKNCIPKTDMQGQLVMGGRSVFQSSFTRN